MDELHNTQMRINFNITMHDLACEYASVDLYDTIGTNKQNVTTNVEKWQLDEDGNRRMYQGRNRPPADLKHELDEDVNHGALLEERHADGVHAVELTGETFDDYVKQREFVFVDFYAPWCIWCQRLAPTWEALAEKAAADPNLHVDVAKVNCVAEANLCRDQRVMAFPTMRFLKRGEAVNGAEYRGDRTADALYDFAVRKVELEGQYQQWPEARKAHARNWNPDHPGCLLVGFIMVKRVPGNFHIEARSTAHSIHAEMANLSHTVNHLSFGNELTGSQAAKVEKARGLELPTRFSPLDGKTFTTPAIHQAYHHYLKVVATRYVLGSSWSNKFFAYQILSTNQVMPYGAEDVPEAKFLYDISPMAVLAEKKGRHFYDYITSLLALLGGTFTMVSLFDNTLYFLTKAKAD